jgi:hypothetical protein
MATFKDLIEQMAKSPVLQVSRDIEESLAVLQKTLQTQYKPYIEAAINQAALPLILETQKSLATSTRLIIDSLTSTLNLPALQKLRERLELDEATVEAFKKAGWVIAPSMPIDLRKRIIKLHRTGNTITASQVIIGYYHRDSYRNLIAVVDSWQSHKLFAPRMHIIRSALAAHCRKEYVLSVPTILPQIEGILIDFVEENQLDVNLSRMREVYEAAIGDPNERELGSWEIANGLLYLLKNNIYDFTNFKDELKKPVRRRRITRHTVLHGINTHYNKASTSLNAFLTLDAIHGLSYWMSSDFNDN